MDRKIPKWFKEMTIPELGDNQSDWKALIPDWVWNIPEYKARLFVQGYITNLTNASAEPHELRTPIEDIRDPSELAVRWFLLLIFLSKRELIQQGKFDPDAFFIELLFDWIFARRPTKRKDAEKALLQVNDEVGQAIIKRWAGKRGRPIILRRAAIVALMYRTYLNMPWFETTKRACPCGTAHTTVRIQITCQPTLEAEVRILKRLLKVCEITLPATAVPITSALATLMSTEAK